MKKRKRRRKKKRKHLLNQLLKFQSISRIYKVQLCNPSTAKEFLLVVLQVKHLPEVNN